MDRVYTSIDEIAAFPQADMPLIVLSANQQSFLSYAICARTNGQYNHLMWMIRPGWYASQDWWYREVPIETYKRSHLKFWCCPSWTSEQRLKIMAAISRNLMKGRWETRYDILNIMGQLFGVEHLQSPYTKICSEHAGHLRMVDPEYDLFNPDPEDVNRWLADHADYKVYGRYLPD